MTRKTLALIACCLATPAIAAAQTGGLTKVQLLGLQQELKDQCGLQHATGVMDGPTRHAIAVCNKKYGTQGNGAALLSAMNVGFTGDNAPEGGMGTVMGNGTDTDNGNATSSSRTWTDSAGVVHTRRARGSRATGASRSAAGRARARARGNNGNGPNRGIIDRDAPLHGVDSTSGGPDVDGRTNDRRMAHDSAMAGRRDGRVRNAGQGKRTKAGRDSVKH